MGHPSLGLNSRLARYSLRSITVNIRLFCKRPYLKFRLLTVFARFYKGLLEFFLFWVAHFPGQVVPSMPPVCVKVGLMDGSLPRNLTDTMLNPMKAGLMLLFAAA